LNLQTTLHTSTATPSKQFLILEIVIELLRNGLINHWHDPLLPFRRLP
jgi:hypothetical protein